MHLLAQATNALWSPWLLALFLVTGLYLSWKTDFFQLWGLPVWLRETVGSVLRPAGRKNGRGVSPAQALCTALASTIGTGSIAGVSTAIWLGGPGAVFWMWVSALLGMMTSFVEKALAVQYRRSDGAGGWLGGPMYYLRDALGSRLLAVWFALACLLATLIGGNLVQSNAIAGSLHAAFGWDRLAVGAVTAALAGVVIVGGLGRVARVSSILVPVMALFYLGGGTAVLLVRAEALPGALELILTSALCPQAVCGGAGGYSVARAMRYGVARGVFTNEAGLGTSAIAHAAADTDSPVRQGMWGILEVGASTLVVCTVTALVLLTTGVYTPGAAVCLEPGTPMTCAAFASVLGLPGEVVVNGSLLLFAFSSILGWSCYGEQCLRFLTGGRRGQRVYRAVFLLCLLVGSVWTDETVWTLVDWCNIWLAVPNLTALLVLAPRLSWSASPDGPRWRGGTRFKKIRKKCN